MLLRTRKSLCDLCRDDSGAVTVDWVVMTAAIVGIGMVIMLPIASGTESVTDDTASFIDGIDAGYMTD